MEMYKQASKQQLRFPTNVGMLTTEQLWNLGITDLDKLAVALEEAYNKAKGKKTFLQIKSEEDKTAKLRFDIALDILTTKVEEMEEARTAQETKEHNQKILGLMAEKRDAQLKGKSLKELEKLLK